jgi:flagellar hook-associated protein 3 FlgL
MTTRVSTGSNYSVMTSNLMRAQIRQNTIGEQVSSQKIANDLKGYAKNAEVLTGMRSAQAKIDGLLDQTKLVSNRLDMQETGVNQLSDATKSAREAIANAMAAGNAQTLMQQLQASFGDAVQGLNTKSNGKYVFAGAQTDTPPTSATSMADLTAAAATSDLFHNDQYIATTASTNRLRSQTGMLADSLGTGVFNAFKQVQAFVDANGPFTGNLTDTADPVPERHAGSLRRRLHDDGHGSGQERPDPEALRVRPDRSARPGRHPDRHGRRHRRRRHGRSGHPVAGGQLAVQASAQVFSTLQASSLLNVLK